MNIDIKTLALVACVINILQVISLSILYRVKMSHAGLGCWIMASGSLALAYITNYLREVPGIRPFAIVANNILFVASLAFIYAGVLRFFNQRGRTPWLVAYCLAETVIALYFTVIDNSLAARRVNLSFATGIMSLLIAVELYKYRIRSVNTSTSFLMLIFFGQSVFLLLRGLTPFLGVDVGNLFTPSLTQTATYMVVMSCSTLWTLGFIIMISQRLAFESQEAKKATEAALENEQQMLQEQRHFLTMVSHEFRTPLAVIDMAATNLTAAPPLDQNDLNQRAQQIRRANRSLVQLIDNCLTSDRIEMGGFQVCRMETELFPLLFETTRIVNYSPRNTIQLEYAEAPKTWFLDVTLMRVALVNLVDNAVKYSDGGVVTVRAAQQGSDLLISVANQGESISAEEAEMLFNKFVRGRAANRG
jgi:signal transduction histidine kinase